MSDEGEPVPAKRVGGSSPRVSVVMVFFNARRYSAEALRLAASRRRDFGPGDAATPTGPPARGLPEES